MSWNWIPQRIAGVDTTAISKSDIERLARVGGAMKWYQDDTHSNTEDSQKCTVTQKPNQECLKKAREVSCAYSYLIKMRSA